MAPEVPCPHYLSWKEAPFPLATDECHFFIDVDEKCGNPKAPENMNFCPWSRFWEKEKGW